MRVTAFPQDGIVIEGEQDGVAPFDRLRVEQVVQQELAPLAGYMSMAMPSLNLNLTSPLASLKDKHPKLIKAAEIAVFLKALDYLTSHIDGKVEGIKDNVRDYLPPKPEYFVQVSNGDFIVNSEHDKCHTLFISGTNKFEFVEAGAGAPRLFDGYLVEPGLTGPEVVRRVLDNAVKSSINTLRFNAFAIDNVYSVLSQNEDGSISVNEGVLQGLDYVLDEAHQRGLRVILVLSDYFATLAGGPLQYMQFADANTGNAIETKAAFYTNIGAQSYFRDYISLVSVDSLTLSAVSTLWPHCFAAYALIPT